MCSPGELALLRERVRIRKPSPSTAMAIGAGLISFVAVLYLPPIYAALGAGMVTVVLNVAQLLAALALLSVVSFAWRTVEPGELLKMLTGWLGVGLLLWALGQAVNGVIQVSVGPYFPGPSLADALWLAGYAPIIFALYRRLHTFGLGLSRIRWTAIIGVNVIVAAAAIRFVILPIVENPDPARPLMTLISVLYIVGDLVIILTTSLIVQTLAQGSMSAPWALVAAGCLMFSTSDMLFAYGTWSGAFATHGAGPTPMMFGYDILLLAAYVTAAVGAYWLARLHRIL